MGRYTDRSRLWELSHTFSLFSVLVVCSLLTYGLFAPLVILFVGYQVSYFSWVIKSLVVLAIHTLVSLVILYGFTSQGGDVFVKTFLIMAGGAYVFVVFLSFYIREYLERLDLKKYMKLEADVSYSYREVKDSIRKLQAQEPDEKELFLAMLAGFRAKITDSTMQDNIKKMEHLASLIVEKEKERSGLFFLKHSSALESIVKQYIELQDLPLVDPETEQLKIKLREVIGLSRKAFENELLALFDEEIMSMTSEADFYRNYVQSKGLI
ncbi:hypothetical protein [Myroides sp. DW712]|uniref:hypothetical protein n=1 Tax=Myroides sp. DW712 TaxID=3389800 RepID=UPI00397E1B63